MAAAGVMYGGSAVVQAYMGFAQANIVREQAQLQASIADFNAELTEYDGWRQQTFGQFLIARAQSEQDQITGAGKVAAAAQGVDIKDGSLSEITKQNELNNMLNINDITNRVSESVLGFKRQASQLRLGADLTRSQGDLQASSLRTGAVVNALSTVGQYAISQQKGKTDPTLDKTKSPTGYKVAMNDDYKVKLQSEYFGDQGLNPYRSQYSLMPGG